MVPEAPMHATSSKVDAKSVPGSSQKMLEKSLGLTVDCVCYDLEDSVTPGEKTAARSNIRRFLEKPRASGIKETAVRINAVSTGLALDDLTEVVCLTPSNLGYETVHGLIIAPCLAQSS